jgi:hypothetical protein
MCRLQKEVVAGEILQRKYFEDIGLHGIYALSIPNYSKNVIENTIIRPIPVQHFAYTKVLTIGTRL